MFNHKNFEFYFYPGMAGLQLRKWFGHDFDSNRFVSGFGAARLERGALRHIILDLLKEQPRHGYDIIQELEKKFHGFYSPSPGSVYPILQLLEDQDYVKSMQESGGKKIYTITEEGKKFLKEHEEKLKAMHERFNHPFAFDEDHRAQMHELKDEVRSTMRLLFHNAAQGKLNSDTVNKVQEAFGRFRKELEEIFSEKK